MDIGRNDPCHCGSGKKYKKCCLPKDEEAKMAAKAATKPAPSEKPEAAEIPAPARPAAVKPSYPPPDPRMDAMFARLEEFEESDYERRIEIFRQSIEDDLMDDEQAFEMLNELFYQAAERNERDRFDALAEELRQRLPEVYKQEEHNMLEWRIINALAAERYELAGALTREMAPLAHKRIDDWNWIERRMAYHGQLTVLVESMRLAWPEVKISTKILPWGIDGFRHRGLQYELLSCVAQTPSPDPNDSVLLDRLKFFDEEIKMDRLTAILDCLAERSKRQWTLDDFRLTPPGGTWRKKKKVVDDAFDAGAQNLFDLAMQFVAYAHRVEGVLYTRAEMAAQEIRRFIMSRERRGLEYRDDAFNPSLDEEKQGRGSAKKFKRYEHMLCPDRERLDRHLAELFDPVTARSHTVAATMELIPAWLRFIESQELIDSELRD
ncbi:MAG: SEC-C domain-containing protein, partial [Blastocatellia bacterium]